ncbi:MAG TPA: hypothetical protein VG722_12690, partial [Tepidisphaeraceae bacterium]|nr:hypothetical protein [Tepidisphaeraceae bacterium]
LLVDAAAFVLTNFWLDIGVFTRHMGISVRLALSFLAVYGAFVGVMLWLASYVLFNSQEDDFVSAGFPLASLGWVVHFVLFISVIIGLSIYSHVTRQAASAARAATVTAAVTTAKTPPPANAPGVAAIPTSASANIAKSKADFQFEQMFRLGLIREGRQWQTYRKISDPVSDAFVRQMYAAGAANVFLDLRATVRGHCIVGYVEQPADATHQATCRAAIANYIQLRHFQPIQTSLHRYIPVRIQ